MILTFVSIFPLFVSFAETQIITEVTGINTKVTHYISQEDDSHFKLSYF